MQLTCADWLKTGSQDASFHTEVWHIIHVWTYTSFLLGGRQHDFAKIFGGSNRQEKATENVKALPGYSLASAWHSSQESAKKAWGAGRKFPAHGQFPFLFANKSLLPTSESEGKISLQNKHSMLNRHSFEHSKLNSASHISWKFFHLFSRKV